MLGRKRRWRRAGLPLAAAEPAPCSHLPTSTFPHSPPLSVHLLQMTGGGKGANLDVFREAATAWEKRQSALRTKLQVQQGWGSFWAGAGPATGSTMQDAARAAAAGGGASSSLGRGVNAATIAAAARKWRDYQRSRRNKEQRLLTTTSSIHSSVDDALP